MHVNYEIIDVGLDKFTEEELKEIVTRKVFEIICLQEEADFNAEYLPEK